MSHRLLALTTVNLAVLLAVALAPVPSAPQPPSAFAPGPAIATAAFRPEAAGPLGTLPGTWFGTLPCPDCAGVRHELSLRPDGVFLLRRTWLGNDPRGADVVRDDLGTWLLARDRRTVVLRGQDGESHLLGVLGRGVLRPLDSRGRPIRYSARTDLRRRERYAPIVPRLRLRGMYSYLSTTGVFQECATRWSLVVAQQGDWAGLRDAYEEARAESWRPLLAEVEGRIESMPLAVGQGNEDVLVVDRLVGVWPGESCGGRLDAAELEDTRWRLVRLGETAVAAAEGSAVPHLRFLPGEARATGSGGCNDFFADVSRDGETLRIGPIGATKKWCEATGAREQAFFRALESARRWQVRGEHLELYDAAGGLLARFEAE